MTMIKKVPAGKLDQNIITQEDIERENSKFDAEILVGSLISEEPEEAVSTSVVIPEVKRVGNNLGLTYNKGKMAKSAQVNIRITPELFQLLKMASQQNEISVNGYIERAIKELIRKEYPDIKI